MSTAIQAVGEIHGFTREQVDTIKATIAPKATDAELSLFLIVCQKTGLDPFSRQIYSSERRAKDGDNWITKKTPETTIDGFRVIAERSGKYQGQVGPFWCGKDGVWVDVWLSDDMPSAARVGVLRGDFKEPLWAVALFCEYVQTNKEGKPNHMWQKMAANQLAKCAESLALRKAFPRDLSGLYTREEMQQAESEPRGSHEAQQQVAERLISENAARRKPQLISAPAHFVEPELRGSDAILPETPEARHAERQQEAEAVIAETAFVPMRPKGDIGFKALGEIKKLKESLAELTDGTDLYYEALKAFGANKANELSQYEGKQFWKALKEMDLRLAQEKTEQRIDRERRDELTKQMERVGIEFFISVIGSNGFETLTELLANATPEQEDTILRELKAL